MNKSQLEELLIYVQNMRENGNSDLRNIIYIINQLLSDKNYIINN